MRSFGLRARIVVLCVSLFMCLANLGSTAFWQDEGLTAFLGTTVLENGVPLAWDGRNLAHDLHYSRLYNDDLVWVGHPWLPFYLAGAAFGIGGVSPFVGRVPFALCGWLTLVLLFPAARAVFRSEKVAWWTLIVGFSSIPLYLYSRQCQYYPLLMLGSVLLWWGLAITAFQRHGVWLIVLGLSLLAWSNPVALVGVIPVCLMETGRRAATRQQRIRFVIAGALAACLFLPYVLYARVWELYDTYQAAQLPLVMRAMLQVWRFLWEANAWILPVAVFPLVLWSMRGTKDRGEEHAQAIATRWLVVELLVFFLVVSTVSPWPFFRYLLPLVPLSFLVLGAVLSRLYARHPVLGVIIAVTLLGTRVWAAAGHAFTAATLERLAPQGLARAGLARLEPGATRLGTAHLEFAHELRHGYVGPVDALYEFFTEHADEGDTLAITYPTEPFAVLTSLRLVARIPPDWPEAQRLPRYISELGMPDWIVVRHSYLNNLIDLDAFMRVHGAAYRRHELSSTDITWNNRPDPGIHHFRAPAGEPRLVIYERLDPATAVPH